MVNAICCEPLSAACSRRVALLDIAGDVLDHHDGVVHDEPGRDRQGHQRQIVQAEPHQIHDAERPDQGQRHRGAGMMVADSVRRNRKITMITNATASISSNCTSRTDARMDVVRSVNTVTWTEGGKAPCSCGKQFFDPIHHLDDIRTRLALNIDDHRRHLIHPRRLLDVFHVIDHIGHFGEMNRRSVAIGNDQRPVVRLDNSWSVALMIDARRGPSKRLWPG